MEIVLSKQQTSTVNFRPGFVVLTEDASDALTGDRNLFIKYTDGLGPVFRDNFDDSVTTYRIGTIQLRTEIDGELRKITIDNVYYAREIPRTILPYDALRKNGYTISRDAARVTITEKTSGQVVGYGKERDILCLEPRSSSKHNPRTRETENASIKMTFLRYT